MSTFAVSGSCCGLIYRFVMDDENCVVLLWLVVPQRYRKRAFLLPYMGQRCPILTYAHMYVQILFYFCNIFGYC